MTALIERIRGSDESRATLQIEGMVLMAAVRGYTAVALERAGQLHDAGAQAVIAFVQRQAARLGAIAQSLNDPVH